MQLRRSPGGSILKSLRSRPEEPPSSVTVTTAARSAIWEGSAAGRPGTLTCLRKPRSNVERPVPPPMATTRIGRISSWGPADLCRVDSELFRASFEDGTEFTDVDYGTSGYSNSVNRG